MKVTVTAEPNCRRVLDIEVSKEEVEAEFANQLLNFRAKALIPGFRPGKAPLNLVKSRFLESVKADVLDTLVPRAIDQAVRQENLVPIGTPEITNIEFEDTHPLKFRAKIEVRPEIHLAGYKKLEFRRQVKQVTDADVDQALKELQQHYAEFHPVERKAHAEDLVIADLIKKYDKLGRIKENKIESVEIDLAGEHVLKEFKEGLGGMGVGEMKEIEIKYPDDYADKDLAGNEVRYLAVVREVKERKLPPLSDDFAANFTDLKSLADLKQRLRENLIRKANDDADIALKSDIINKLVESNRFEVPESLVEGYLRSVAEDFKKRYTKVDELELRRSYRPVAENTLRWQFIFREIARVENIRVTEDDRTAWTKQFAEAYNTTEEEARSALGKAGKFEDIDDTLLEKKVLDFIKDNSKIKS